ncbi:hypothetical protein IQ07DRAFT_684348 [Pyrenochaeta sp. DS3sAY3a]|nr:hypothetical protein IQ07DRAFT_684348 [Pyrenochaeta sp. DS3sAY3a]
MLSLSRAGAFSRPFHIQVHWLLLFSTFFIGHGLAQETYTDAACIALNTSMASCAQRWDSIRQDCTKTVNTNTVWPGPCECAYYANDLPCFDDQALCAHQIWTQVPQWFRDGVTSCLMKDESYTIRADLGSSGNPFLSTGIAGNATRITSSTPTDSISLPTAQTGGSIPPPTSTPTGAGNLTEGSNTSKGLSSGAKAGIGVGIGVGVLVILAIVFLFVRRKQAQASRQRPNAAELHDEDAEIHEIEVEKYSKHELAGDVKPELDGTARNEADGSPKSEIAGSPTSELGGNPRHETDGTPMNEVDGKSMKRYEME